MTGSVVRDSRERDENIQALVPDSRFLSVNNPHTDKNAAPWSYDFHVVTAYGQEIRVERKEASDSMGSWTAKDADGRSKLDRQCSYVDLLIVEWGRDPPAPPGVNAIGWQKRLVSLKKHLMRLNMEVLPVWFTRDQVETVALLEYLSRKKEPIRVRKAQEAAATHTGP